MFFNYKITNSNSEQIDEYIKINFNNLSYLEIKEENSDSTSFNLIYRYKASQKTKSFTIKLSKNDISKFLMKYNIFRFLNYFINVKNISFIEETILSKHHIKLNIHFIDGTYLIINSVNKQKWEEWAKVRLN